MKICTPALATAGLFAAVLILDLKNKEYRLIMGHSLMAFVSVLLVLYLCEKSNEMAAWILLATPFILIFLGWSIGALSASGKAQHQSSAQVQPSSGVQFEQAPYYGYGSCNVCQQYPCTCNQASVEVPKETTKQTSKQTTTDASGNTLEYCGSSKSPKQCINVDSLTSA